jgi:peptidylprolyl isomerase
VKSLTFHSKSPAMRILKSILFSAFTLFAVQSYSQSEVIMYTTMGQIHLEMSDSLTPITSGNFLDLADSGYYDGVIFHRVINNFMIQGGDPTGTGSGGPGYAIPDEFDTTGTLSNTQKSISMANSGPNTGGSQFFINLVNNTYLDWDNAPTSSAHPVFGMVVDSFVNVQAIGAVATNSSNRPLVDVVMDSVRVISWDTVWPDTNSTDTTGDTTGGIDTNALGFASPISQTLKTSLFPNPVGLSSVLVIESKKEQTVRRTIYDQSGRVVHSDKIPLRRGMNRFTDVDDFISRLESGIYFLELKGPSESSRKKFIVAARM